ncbi:MAG: EAL domain-containing protein, partial [Butyrivibrio sp.]|nr:EAL domain-containing protein [Butyrivibrio sp.]
MNDFDIWEELASVIETVDLSNPDVDANFIQFSSNLQKLANYMHLAKTEVHLVVIPNVFELSGKNTRYKYSYDSKAGDFDSAFQVHYESLQNHHIETTFYPTAGYQWSDLEKHYIRAIANIVTAYLTNASMAKTLSEVQYLDIMTGLIDNHGLRRIGAKLYENNVLKNYTAVYFNLKNFQYINNKYGIRNGDNIICQLALYAYRYAQEDEYVCRLGGDNFFVLLKKDKTEDFLQYMAEVNIDIHFQDSIVSVPVRARYGIYDIQPGDKFMSVMGNATVAFDMARKTQNDMVTFTEEMSKTIMEHKRMVSSFPKIIQNGELQPYYQPKVNIDTNEMCGCEALVRWNRDGKVVLSEEFLEAIETDSVIRELDKFMLETVCSDIRRWLDQGIEPVPVSINYSKMNLQNPNLGEDTMQILSKYNIDSKYIEIEMTETSGYDDMKALKKFISQMHSIGVNVAMDDFGTGYSSINIFKHLDFDVIKLDKSFCDNIENDVYKDKVIRKNIINMLGELKV